MPDFRYLYKEQEYKNLFEEFYIPLVIFAGQFTRNREAAEDIVEEVFVHLWEKQLKFEHELALRTYLYRSVQNGCMNYLRHLRVRDKHFAVFSQHTSDAEPQFFQQMIQEEVYRQLFSVIDRLPGQCKKICQLSLEGKKPSEIALLLGLAVETVKKQKKIALKRIQDHLGRFSIFTLIAHLLFFTASLRLPQFLPILQQWIKENHSSLLE